MGHFAQALSKLIELEFETNAALCREIKLAPTHLSGILAGRRMVGPKVLASILEAFPVESHQIELLAGFLNDHLQEIKPFLPRGSKVTVAIGECANRIGK